VRILLVQKSTYFPTHGGADKSNRALVEGLARKGHICRVVTSGIGSQGLITREEFHEVLAKHDIVVTSVAEIDVFRLSDVDIHAVMVHSQLRAYLEKQIHEFEPTWILVSSEDTGQILMEVALKLRPSRVVYLAHTPIMLPFGPQAFLPSEARTQIFRRLAGIITVSGYIRDYIKRWSEIDAAVIPYPVYGNGPYSSFGCFDKGFVTLINPCSYKGISIFLGLAQALPDVQFAAVPTWGTSDEDLAALERLSNVHIWPAVDNIDEIFARTRILLVPSLWLEAYGLVATEAMLRGIPVLASDSGGLPEAKLGIDYVLPVRQIERFSDAFDNRMKPKAITPEQNIEPWLAALRKLLTDRLHYEQISADSREAALAFVAGISIDPFEAYLEDLLQKGRGSTKNTSISPKPRSSPEHPQDLISGLSPEKRALLLQRLNKRSHIPLLQQTISKRPRTAERNLFPLSFAQQGIWFLEQLEPGLTAYNSVSAFHLSGSLNLAVLAKSLNEIIGRHEALRTVFDVQEGRPVQIILPTLILALPVVDLTGIAKREQEAETFRLVAEQDLWPFDLTQGPLLRPILLRLDETEYVFLLTIHHIICDGWSVGILVQEVAALYDAFTREQASPLPALPIQYVDFAAWQQEQMQGGVLTAQLAYWKQQLSGSLSSLALPTDRARPGVKTFQGATQSFRLSPPLTIALKNLGKQGNATLFMTLLAVFKVLLHYYTGQDDLIVGTDIANRNRVEVEGIIGLFANQLVLRTNLSGNPSFQELLQRVRKVALDAYTHQDFPFEKLLEVLKPKRDPSRTPLFQVKFVLQAIPISTMSLSGVKLEVVEIPAKKAKFDLLLNMWDTEDGLFGLWEYSTDLFRAATITHLSENLELLTNRVVAQPDVTLDVLRHELATQEKRRQVAEDQMYQEAIRGKLKHIRRKHAVARKFSD
jgi:glycosyltransferase involved in cell wall biosynthesis